MTFNLEPYDLYGSFFESVAGIELARRGLHHTFCGCFGYASDLPPILDQRELIASELDHKGRVLRELRAWDDGLVELRIERTPETRRRIDVWGYFDSKDEAAQCLAALTRHLPSETTQLCEGTVNVSFWNAAMVRGDYQPRRESQVISVPSWKEMAENYPDRIRPALADTMRLREATVATSRMMLWRGRPVRARPGPCAR